MNILELLRRMQAPAVDTETGYYNTYQPKIKQVITETDDNQPNKRVTTIDYPKVDTRELGSLSMGPLSMMAAERRGYDPMLMQSEEKIPMDQLYTDTIGNTGLTRNQIINQGLQNVANAGLMEGAQYGPGAMAGITKSGAAALMRARRLAALERAARNKDLAVLGAGTVAGLGAASLMPGEGTTPEPFQDLMVSPEEVTYPNQRPVRDVFPGPSAQTEVYNPVTGETISLAPQVPADSSTPSTVQSGRMPGSMTEPGQRLPGSAPFESSNLMYGENAEGQVVQRMPYTSMRGFQTEGRKQEIAKQKEENRIWGNFAYDPAEAQQRYEDTMKDVFKKSMMLNAIAQLTGGQSQASAYIAMATKRMEAEEAFKDQGRLQNIQRGIYYTEDGVYDPPKNKEEAFERAMKFGASADLASKVSGYAPEKDKRAWNNWYRIVDGKLEETVMRTGDKPEGDGWKKGTYSAPSGSGGTETERALDRVDSLVSEGNVAGAIQELERVFAYKSAGDITSKQSTRLRDAVDIVWKSISASLKVQVPEGIKTREELAQWEAQQKAAGVRGYYRLGDEIGIIQ